MRAIWSGTLSFGLLNIPVNLFSASRERALRFHLFDKTDNCPISYKKVCKSNGHAVDSKDIVKGYEYEKGQYVILSSEDVKKANARKTGTIDIESFTDESGIQDRYFEKPYFIVPDEKSAKAYVLLHDALKNTKKVGVARFVLRDKEHIAVIRPEGTLITLIQLRFNDELADPSGFAVPKVKYTKKELAMAESLVESLNEPFEPNKFKDMYNEELMKIIEAKAKGKKIVPVGREPVPSPLDTDTVLKLLQESMRRAKE